MDMVKHKNEKRKKKMVVNLGKGGGGIGGIIFLGGVLFTGILASVIALKRRNQKLICGKKNNPKTSASLPSFDSEEESKGLQLLVSNCCTKENEQLSNEKSVAGLRKASSVTSLISAENLCKDNHNDEQRAKIDDGNMMGLDNRKLQMEEGEKPSSSSTHEDNYQVSIAQSSILNRKRSNLGSVVSDKNYVNVMENEEKICDGKNIEKCNEFDDDEVIKHDLELPNSGVILDGEDLIEDDGNLRTLSIGTQHQHHHHHHDTSTRIESDERCDYTNSAEANIAAVDLIEKSSEGNTTCEDDDESHECSEEVADSSEGALDSSAESNSEAIWPAETIQEISMVHKAGPDKDNIQKTNAERLVPVKKMNHNGGNSKQILEIRNDSRTRRFDLYNLQLNSMKRSILLGTLLALLLLLHLYFRNVLAF